MPHALIVEDDADSAEMLAHLIKAEGFDTAIAPTLAAARQQLVLRAPDVVLLDLVLPDGSGMDLFADAAELGDTQIVLITGNGSLETSIEALRFGAADYLLKPINVKQLKGVLSRVAPPSDLRARVSRLERDVQERGSFGRLWGRSAAMRRVYEQMARVAATAVPVLVTGESGTGKELVARTIHELSRRSDRPFLAVNCGAISPQLIESEMFGHEKGSFTGAMRQHRGYFERAHGGTLLLDEVAETPLDLQVKLLRVLETRAFLRVGADAPVETDVRIVAATNRVPQEAVAAGKLREDLYYRLNVFPIHLPPLRDRPEDVALLAEHFLRELNQQEGTARRFTAGALEALRDHAWPGNVRELRNAVQRAFIMVRADAIDEHALPLDGAPDEAAAPGDYLRVKVGTSVAEMERRLILATVEHTDGHKERAAAILGLSPKTLYNRLRAYEQGGEAHGK